MNAALTIAEQILEFTPTKYDDIVVDVFWGAIRKATDRDAAK